MCCMLRQRDRKRERDRQSDTETKRGEKRGAGAPELCLKLISSGGERGKIETKINRQNMEGRIIRTRGINNNGDQSISRGGTDGRRQGVTEGGREGGTEGGRERLRQAIWRSS